jgi:hypothetical protein
MSSGGRKNWASQIMALLGFLSLRGWFLDMPSAFLSNELGVPDSEKYSARISNH